MVRRKTAPAFEAADYQYQRIAAWSQAAAERKVFAIMAGVERMKYVVVAKCRLWLHCRLTT